MSKTNSAVKKPSKMKSASKKKTLMLTTMVLPGAIWLLLLRIIRYTPKRLLLSTT